MTEEQAERMLKMLERMLEILEAVHWEGSNGDAGITTDVDLTDLSCSRYECP